MLLNGISSRLYITWQTLNGHFYKIAAPVSELPQAEVKVLDGAVMVQAIPGVVGTTFAEYANNVIIPAVKRELVFVDRLDNVWDVYKKTA